MDIYVESRKLAEILRKHNDSTISNNILDAIDYSSTGTEILMKLRCCLNELLANNSFKNTEISELARKILVEINLFLNQ